MNTFLSVVLSALALSASVLALGDDSLLVKTTNGYVEGRLTESGIRYWKGIPYAKPPVGESRWAYPESPAPFQGTYQATFDAAGCPQHCNLPPGNCPAYGTSEDCLYLSVFAPKEPSKDPEGYPVFFWIHGGAFEQGLGNCALYNGTTFAQKDIITVTINYRLGALGFMASESMTGNYGFMDQRKSLQWTIDNIAQFGGNPNKITIGGQSAGAMSVSAHMVSGGSKGMFQQGIVESNPLALPFHTRESATTNANDIFEYLGCADNDVECMRAQSVDDILDAQDHAVKLDLQNLLINFLPFAPLVDPAGEIPAQPFTAMADGAFEPVPLLMGSMYDEGQLFVYELFPKPIREKEYYAIVDLVFGAQSSKTIKEYYPFDLVSTGDGRDVFNVLATDLLFYCPLRNATRGFESSQQAAAQQTFIYRFKHVISFDCWGENYTFCVGEVCHGSELPFVFNVFTDGAENTYYPTDDEVALADDLGKAWSNFIANGNPNTGFAVPRAYPIYEPVTDALIVLDKPDSDTQTHVRSKYCDMWDSIGYFY